MSSEAADERVLVKPVMEEAERRRDIKEGTGSIGVGTSKGLGAIVWELRGIVEVKGKRWGAIREGKGGSLMTG